MINPFPVAYKIISAVFFCLVLGRNSLMYGQQIKLVSNFRPRKSPVEPTAESGAGDASGTKSRSATAPYYEERYRERRDRDPPPADRDRDRDRDHRRDARH
ncbi:unnamed protein product [Parnassius mnemosyne]|uniref:Uncharacterized protein n=1 Tax=Parnassius mnemosyne TaxID=213953 RepID=A0AAV1L563_9NEOP